eukprot:51944-Eustigmatos_ZCMA.PRE.1
MLQDVHFSEGEARSIWNMLAGKSFTNAREGRTITASGSIDLCFPIPSFMSLFSQGFCTPLAGGWSMYLTLSSAVQALLCANETDIP